MFSRDSGVLCHKHACSMEGGGECGLYEWLMEWRGVKCGMCCDGRRRRMSCKHVLHHESCAASGSPRSLMLPAAVQLSSVHPAAASSGAVHTSSQNTAGITDAVQLRRLHFHTPGIYHTTPPQTTSSYITYAGQVSIKIK